MAQAVHQFTTGHDGGGGAPFDRVDVVSIGGTATAGDLIEVVTSAVAGAYDEIPAVTDNVSGGTGWSVAFDVTAVGGENLRIIGFKKVCVGGETTVTSTWTGPVNHVIVGAWISDPVLPDIICLGAGHGYNFFGEQRFNNAIPVPDAGATYVGGVGWGNSGVTLADFDTPTAFGGVGTLTAGNGAGGIQHYNDVGGTAGQTLVYRFQPQSAPTLIMYWWATAEAVVPPVTGASDGGLVEGSATPTIGEPAGSSGGLIEGDATPLVVGGLIEGASDGGLVAGRPQGTVIDPFPPVPNQPAMTGQLDCGVYDVFVFTRGLGTIVGRIPFNLITWTRVLDDTSSAEVTVNGVSNVGPMQSCCQLLGSIMPWEHELGIYRNGLRVWSGPVVKVSFPSETVIIDCLDLSGWLQIRNLHSNHNFVAPNADLADNWVAIVDDAMSVDNSAGLYPHVQALTGVQGERLYTEDMHVVAADAVSELARTGLDWYCVDRRMVGGPVAVQPPAYPDAPPIPTLIDESFRDAPTVERDGGLMANCWYVNGMGSGPAGNAIFGQYGPHFPATPDHVESPAAPDYSTIEGLFGRIERIVSETKILDQPSIDQNAATRYDLTKLPVDVISSGTLLPTAGIDIRQLIPGSIQNVHLTRACVAIGSPYRLKQLTVTAQGDGAEQVEGTWEPVGSVAAHEDLG